MSHDNNTKAIYIPTDEFEKFMIIANRLPLDTKIINITHALNQNAYIIMLYSNRFPKQFPLNMLELLERLMFRWRGDLWTKRKPKGIK